MVPKNMLVDSFVYKEYDGKDRNHAPVYKDGVTVGFVRINRKRTYHRDSSESSVRYEAKIFCYEEHTEPFVEFKEQSKVIFDGKEYIVVDISTFTEPFSNNKMIYELGVV